MSRVAKNPIVVPSGVEVTVAADKISVKGPLGTLTQALKLMRNPELSVRWWPIWSQA